MTIVFPMAGLSRRFTLAGYTVPKSTPIKLFSVVRLLSMRLLRQIINKDYLTRPKNKVVPRVFF